MRQSIRWFLTTALFSLLVIVQPFTVFARDNTTESHKKMVQRMVDEGLNKGNLAVFDELFTPDYVNRGISGTMGVKGYQDYIAAFRAAMPDFQVTTEVMIAEGNFVASRFVYSGTLKNSLVRPEGTIAPHNQRVRWALNVFHRFDNDGKIAEVFTAFDQLSLLMQLGASPTLTILKLLSQPEVKPIKVEPDQTKDKEQQHKAAFQRFIEQALNQGNLDAMDEILAPEYMGHDPFGTVDRKGFKNVIAAFRHVVPDLHVTADIMIAEGDWAAARLIYRGTFKNKLDLPIVSIPPTNKPVVFIINVLVHLNENSQDIEDWKEFNRLAWLQQIGLIPAS